MITNGVPISKICDFTGLCPNSSSQLSEQEDPRADCGSTPLHGSRDTDYKMAAHLGLDPSIELPDVEAAMTSVGDFPKPRAVLAFANWIKQERADVIVVNFDKNQSNDQRYMLVNEGHEARTLATGISRSKWNAFTKKGKGRSY